MEWLQQMLDSSTTPLLTAFLLGLLTAISPCPLATNITAIGFIGRDIENKHRIFWNGLMYSLGRIISYTALGVVLIILINQGASVFSLQKTISSYGEIILAPALILIGLFMLFGHKLPLPKFGVKTQGKDHLKEKGSLGALMLGILFALAFCPTSGVFYFGMLIPMSAEIQTTGYILPVIFAFATALPVIVFAWVLAYSVSGIGKVYNSIKTFQFWFSKFVALLFIAVGIYYAIIYLG